MVMVEVVRGPHALVMELAPGVNLKATFFRNGLSEWKKKFELGGIRETPSLLDSPLMLADRASLFKPGFA